MSTPVPTDPEAIRASILSIPITDDPIPGGPEEQMDPKDRILLERHFDLAKRGHPTAITVFRQLVRQYPDVPSLKNFLFIAYSSAGRIPQAEKVLDETVEKHPDYLFGRLNLASRHISDGETARARALLGEGLHLPDLEPGRTLYHLSELRDFYRIAATLLLEEEQLPTARAVLDALEEILGHQDPVVSSLRLDVIRHGAEDLCRRMDEDEARAVHVTVPKRPRNPTVSLFPPPFHHPEIGDLYRYGFDLPVESIAALLALPRETFVADLEAVLRDSRRRSDLFIEKELYSDESETMFAFHALFLLGELGAVESLPLVYDTLAEDDEWLAFWFSHELSIEYWRPLLQLVADRLDEAADWVLAPGRPSFSREALATAVGRLALLRPERREEAMAWFRRVLGALLEAEPGNGILDTRFVTSLVSEALTMRAVELRPLVAAHYEKGHIALSWVGDLDVFDREMEESPLPHHLEPLDDLAACYRRHVRRYRQASEEWSGDKGGLEGGAYDDGSNMPESDLDRLEQRLLDPKASPVRADPKTGRNDPCPCGSGKKFKKCCG